MYVYTYIYMYIDTCVLACVCMYYTPVNFLHLNPLVTAKTVFTMVI